MSDAETVTGGPEAILRGGMNFEDWQALVRVASAVGASVVLASNLPPSVAEQAPPLVTATLADFRSFRQTSKFSSTQVRYWTALTEMAEEAEQGARQGIVPFTVRFATRLEGQDGGVHYDNLDVRSLADYVAALDQWTSGMARYSKTWFLRDELPKGIGQGAIDSWREFAQAKLAEPGPTVHTNGVE